MSNTCFNGDFRQKPKQNFSGSNRNLQRDELIQQAAQERKQREEIRKHTLFATKLQSHIRKYLVKRNYSVVFRNDFDEAIAKLSSNHGLSLEQVDFLGARLVRFYDDQLDRQRLFYLNKILLSNDKFIPRENANWLKYIFKLNLLLLSKNWVNCSHDDDEEYKKILELFAAMFDVVSQRNPNAERIWHYLIMNGYFQDLQKTIGKVYQQGGTEELVKLLSRQMLTRPLSIITLSSEHLSALVRNFFHNFLSGPINGYVQHWLLDQLCCELPQALNICHIVDSLINFTACDDIFASTWMFYSFQRLVNVQLNLLDESQVRKYLLVVKGFGENLSLYFKKKNYFKFDFNEADDEEDEDEDSDSERKNDPVDVELVIFLKEIFTLFNKVEYCNVILKFIENNCLLNDNDCLSSITIISHHMLLFHPFAIHQNRFLHTIAFNANFIRLSWDYVLTKSTDSIFSESPKTYATLLSNGIMNTSSDWHQYLCHLTLFSSLFNYFLQTLDDVEFFTEYLIQDMENNPSFAYNYSILPFRLNEIVHMSSILRDICIALIELAYQDRRTINYKLGFGSTEDKLENDEYSINCLTLLMKSSLKLLRHIYARDIRRRFCPEGHWCLKRISIHIVPANFNVAIQQRGHLYREFRGIRHLGRNEIEYYGSPIPVKDIVNVTLIQELPFVVSFFDRVKIMQSLVAYEKRSNESDYLNAISHGAPILIRRNYIYEDSFDKLNPDTYPNLKKVIRIQLMSSLGLEETGIDGGGVFREFLAEALKAAFDPNRGLFKLTNDGLLYPNPTVHLLINSSENHYYFIGRLLGKAIYENMLIELPLAPFFLAKLLTVNNDIEINHLASLDPLLYKNLISLKNYKGDVSDLGLDFTAMTSELGTSIIDELKANGANIAVTNQNRIEYIHLMADYRLNKQIRNQCVAFKKGFYNVVNFDWIKMFDTKELQILISGAPMPINLNDLQRHTVYTGGYSQDHPVIQIFWEVVFNFDENDKRKLLKFITSCSRPPLLGFKDLYPAFCIQNAGREPDRLPTSSTCMNLLKLPEVYDKKVMKDKLLYSISSSAGFELS